MAPSFLDVRGLEALLLEPGAWEAREELAPLQVRLKRVRGEELPLRTMPDERKAASYIWFAIDPAPRQPRMIRPLTAPPAGGYRLAVGAEAAFLLGRDLEGLRRGLAALIALIGEDGRLPRVVISDWPPDRSPPRGVDKRLSGVPPGGTANGQGFPELLLHLSRGGERWAWFGYVCLNR